MIDDLFNKLKKAIRLKDTFSASILLTRIHNLGYTIKLTKEEIYE